MAAIEKENSTLKVIWPAIGYVSDMAPADRADYDMIIVLSP